MHEETHTAERVGAAPDGWVNSSTSDLQVAALTAQKVMRHFNSDLSLTPDARKQLIIGLFGAFDSTSTLCEGARVDFGRNIYIGKRCYFNFNCVFLDGAPIRFGDDTMVGPNCTFSTPLHPLLGSERREREDEEGGSIVLERNLPITVGNEVWIAANVTVNPGVTIGDGAVIGSGSVVTHDIAPHTLAYGNPCREIRTLGPEDSIGSVLGELA